MGARGILPALVLVAFAIVAYAPSFDVPFAFDDLPNLVENPRVQPERPVQLLRAFDARGGQDRPVAMFTFALNYLYGGLDTFGYHLINLLVHVVNGLLLFALVTLLARERPVLWDQDGWRLGFFGALIWVVHPLNTQAVTYIVQRMTSLAVLFYLVAVLVFVLWRSGSLRGAWAWMTILLAFAAGMGTKAIVVTLPAALLLVDWVFFRRFNRWHGLGLGALAVAVAGLAALYGATAIAHLFEELPGRSFSAYDRVLTQGRVLWNYISLYVLPLPGRLQLDYDIVASTGWTDPTSTLLAWASIGVLTALALRYAQRYPWACFAWLFFILTSSVEASFLNLELAFEHRAYLPTTFFAVGILAQAPVCLNRPSAGVAVIALAGALALGSLERNREWAAITSFWTTELERGSSPERATLNAAARLSRAGHYAEALELIRRYDRPHDTPDGIRMLQVKGEALFAAGRYEEAIPIFRQVLDRAPPAARPRYFLGQIHLARGEVARAKVLANELGGADGGPFSVTLSALVSRGQGQPGDGVQLIRRYLDNHVEVPASQEIMLRLHLAHLLRAVDRYEAAMDQYREIISIDPRNWPAWSFIYQMLRAGGDDEQARKVLRYMEQHGANPEGW